MRAVPFNLGAPGIYRLPESEPPVLGGVPMDVCAFLGVAPRGPAREPVLDEGWRFDRPCVEADRERRRSVAVAVESFDEYRRLFGGFEGPGRLPFAVASFFEQGGRRAYVVRIVHDYEEPDDAGGVAEGVLTGSHATLGDLKLAARDEGSWGNGLRAALGYGVTPLAFEASSTVNELHLDPHEQLGFGTLLRIRSESESPELRFVSALRRQPRSDGPGEHLHAVLDSPLPVKPTGATAEVVTGILELADGEGRLERHTGLGLSRLHERWLATVLCYESTLVYPEPSWVEGQVLPDDPQALPFERELPPPEELQFSGGEDRYADITPEDFFDPGWVLGNPEPGSGIHAITRLQDLSTVLAPDLYTHQPTASTKQGDDEPPLAASRFEPCVERSSAKAIKKPERQTTLKGLHLNPADPDDLDMIIQLQGSLVSLAEALGSFVVLLDVPPGLSHRQVLSWRSKFSSSYAAAYHPWLKAARPDDSRDALVDVNPAAVAAGIIAAQERRFGVPHGPANVIARTAVDVDRSISPERHDELHPLGINVYLRERDGVRLTAARTLSRDPAYRQLSVRRLMIMLRRVLSQQTHWMVFEPNGPGLRAATRQMLRSYLRQLFLARAFTGATEDEAFFVHCDEVNNPPRIVDAGQLIAEIGVAPAEPTEFIVLRLIRSGDGTLTVQE